MTAGRRGVGFTPMETRRDVIVRAAVLADELGYEFVALPEGWGLDSVPVLTEIALRTSVIQVVSSIMSVWGRTPATLAMTAATLNQVSTGRFILGLGASTRALAEGFHDVPFEHPAVRLRDTVTGAERDLPVGGLFIAIGHLPRTDIVVGQIDLDDEGYIATDGFDVLPGQETPARHGARACPERVIFVIEDDGAQSWPPAPKA